MKKLTILCVTCLMGSLIFGQSGIRSNIQTTDQVNKDFEFRNESSTQEVTLKIGPNCERIMFKCNGEIFSGQLNIKFIDPNGKKEGGFTLEAEKKSNGSNSNSNSNSDDNGDSYVFVFSGNGKSRGNMNKNIKHPLEGTWVVKIKANGVSGKAEVNLKQTSNE